MINYSLAVLCVCLILLGCGTTQQFVPPVPLAPGKTEVRFSIGYSTGNFRPFTLQLGGYAFLGKRDAIGITLAGIVVPSTLSYVHYWPTSSGSSNIQAHYNDLFGATYNPTFQMKLGLSSGARNSYSSAHIGIGYYGTPLVHALVGNRVIQGTFVPTVAYQFRSNEFAFEAEMIYGMSKYFVHYYKYNYMHRHIDTQVQFTKELFLEIVPHSSITRIAEVTEGPFAPGWHIFLNSNETIVLASRDPYADCIGCDIDYNARASHLASPDHRLYWIWTSRQGDEEHNISSPRLIELNMKQLSDEYRPGKDLILREELDLVEKTLGNVHSGLQDIFFSVSKVSKSN